MPVTADDEIIPNTVIPKPLKILIRAADANKCLPSFNSNKISLQLET